MKVNLDTISRNAHQIFYRLRWGGCIACPVCGSIHIYNPEAIIIGGGISKRENFTLRVERYMNSHLPTGFRDTAKVLTASYRNDGGMMGAYYNFIEYIKRGE